MVNGELITRLTIHPDSYRAVRRKGRLIEAVKPVK
jgi:hypothetical protein